MEALKRRRGGARRRLSERDEQWLVLDYLDGKTQRFLSEEYGVTGSTVQDILRRRNVPRRAVSARNRRARLLAGCPKCGGHWTRRAGLVVCQACDHLSGSQNPEGLRSSYGQVIQPHQFGGAMPWEPVDDEPNTPGDMPGRQDKQIKLTK